MARVAERSFGLGPLEPLLRDASVDEVMVNGAGPVWVERGGRLEATDVAFASDDEVRHAIERILAPLGRRVDEAEPLCDARLPDGSRVNVVIPPLALDGPVLTIRRFRQRGFSDEDLVELGTWSPPLRDFLARAVRARLNILVTGGTGSGKTTTLNALSSFVPAGERIVTIEDTAELRLRQPHVVRLEARPPSVEGRGEVTIRRLVRNALRMRPDRIVVGEVRGPEALDMLAAMSTGHDGSLCTVHAGSPEEALRRLETLALMAGLGLPHAAIREQVCRRDRPHRPPGAPARRRAARRRGRRGRARRRRARRPARSTAGAATGRSGARRWATPLARRLAEAGVTAWSRRCSRGSPARSASRARGRRSPRSSRPRSSRPGASLAPLRAAGREGREPSPPERRRLALVGAAALLAGRLAARRAGAGIAAAAAGPWLLRRVVAAPPRALARRARARRAGGGAGDGRRARRRPRDPRRDRRGRPRRRAPGRRGRRAARRGPRLRARRAHRGRPRAPAAPRGRPGWDTIVAAILLQREAGGDLARLLRSIATAQEDAARVEADARSLTAQARFTAWLVTLLPGGRGGARRARPARLPRLARAPPLTAALVVVAVGCQVVAGVLVRRIARLEGA